MVRTGCNSVVLIILVGYLSFLSAQSAERGFTFYSSFQGNSSNIGFVTRLDNSLGYNFNHFLGVDVGVPFYFIRPSDSLNSQLGSSSVNGIGNAYTDLRLAVPNPILNYLSTITITAPTGDRDKGLSTGKVTWDWNNHFDRSFGGLAPFVNLGIANTITDTPFYVRPFVSRGFVSHFEGGANVRLARFFGVGGSAYTYEPNGEQTVVSRLVHRGQAPVTVPGQGRGGNKGVFESAWETVGPASIARDCGYSFWLDIIPARVIFLEAGYSRSMSYSLDTVFGGVGVNVGSLVRAARRQ